MRRRAVNLKSTSDLFDAVRKGNVRKVRALIKQNEVNVNLPDKEDPTKPCALLVAAELNNTQMVKAILKSKKPKCDPDLENTKGKRAVWYAAKNCNEEMLQHLIDREVDVNFLDKETGCTPLYRAIISNNTEICRKLIHAGADVNLRRLGYGVGAESPLIKAVQLNNKEIADMLINSLCDIHYKTEEGLTALHYAISYRRYDIVELLLTSKIKIHAKTNHGVTAMTVAIEHHNPAMCRILIEFGYKMDRKYEWGESPLQQAIQLHSTDCAIALILWGCSVIRPSDEMSYFSMAAKERLIPLVRLLGDINPLFLNEMWIQKKNPVLSFYHIPEFYNALFEKASCPMSLKGLCRAKIFRYMVKYQPHKVKKLPIPEKLKDYICFNEYVKEDLYNRRPLDITECPYDCDSKCELYQCPDIEVCDSTDSDEF